MNKLKSMQDGFPMPKKSATAFNLFGKRKRAEIKDKYPKAKYYAVVREMANSWARMNKTERQLYK
jgi:hypothetical protein